jgi:hypothetical protein
MDAHYWQRECGRYTVDVAPIPGSLSGYRYCAWRRSSQRDGMAENLGCFDQQREAFGACTDDLRSRTELKQ